MSVEDLNPPIDDESISEEDQQQLDSDFKEVQPEGIPKEPVAENIDEEDTLGPEHDNKTEEEREAIRVRRRAERQNKKNFRKEKDESYRREIEGLKRQLSEVNEWKNSVESRRVQSGVAQLDKALRDSVDAIEVAKKAISEATETQNGPALVDAQELYYAARKRVDELNNVKRQMSQRQQQPPQQNIDPSIVKKAQGWMEGKEWYNPTGQDPDSRIALTVDNGMAEEGWDPRTAEYWEELDSRLKKYLPHRYNTGYTAPKRGDTPPTGASSQTRGSASSSNFTLSPERVKAMKEAGYWDDAEKRKTMIRRYMEQDRNSKS